MRFLLTKYSSDLSKVVLLEPYILCECIVLKLSLCCTNKYELK